VSTVQAGLAHKPGVVRWRADLALVLVALVWGATFVVVKRALTEISTFYFLAIRFSLASLCLLALFSGSFRAAGAQTVWRGLRGGAAAGVFLWLGYTLQTFGLKYTTAGKSGFLTGFFVVLVPVLAAVFFRKRPQWIEVAGILIATAGIFLLTLPSVHGELHVNPGDLLTIGCAVAYAFHLLVLGYYSQRERVEAVALGQIATTALLSTLGLVFEPPRAVWGANVIFALVVTAVFATAAAFTVQTWAQRYTTPTRTALIFSLEPVFALATAVLIGGEALTLPGVIGGTFIVAGILAVELKR
jgi:drug/metabolite transporter (DMT)-like permease